MRANQTKSIKQSKKVQEKIDWRKKLNIYTHINLNIATIKHT